MNLISRDTPVRSDSECAIYFLASYPALIRSKFLLALLALQLLRE